MDVTESRAAVRKRLTHAQENSMVGLSLATTITMRFSRFFVENDTFSNWVESLGPSGVLASHQPYFTELLLELAQAEWFSEEDLDTLNIAGAVHDIGEAKVPNLDGVGDIPAHLKTDGDNHKEAVLAAYYISQLEDLTPEFRGVVAEAYVNVVVGNSEKLHRFFKAVERLEYVDTVMHIFKSFSRRPTPSAPRTITRGKEMVARILANDFAKVLRENVPEFPLSIGGYLLKNRDEITDAYAFARTCFSNGELNDYHEKFLESFGLWCVFLEEQLKAEKAQSLVFTS